MHIPPCGARKTHRAYADPRVFRPLRKLRPCFFCHWQRKAAIPPGLSILIRIPLKKRDSPPRGTVFFWCSSGDSHASLFPLRETVKRDKGIRQCPHWLMHIPPCGARKTHRAYADPRVFRPLRKLRPCLFCHWQRKAAIPPGLSILIRIPVKKRDSPPRGTVFFSGAPAGIRMHLFSPCGRRGKEIKEFASVRTGSCTRPRRAQF